MYNHSQQKKVTKWIAEMIVMDSQPLSFEEDTVFLPF